MRSSNSESKTTILETSIPLFARAGYDGVTMREIARGVGIKAASLYYHFPDKQSLYIAAMKHAFSGRATILSEPLSASASSEERLAGFVLRLCEVMHHSPDFSLLVHREILEGDEERLRIVAKQVFKEIFNSISSLSQELSRDYDPHLLAISIIGLVAYHYQTGSIRIYLPGSNKNHIKPKVIANHVTSLLMRGILRTEARDEKG